MRVFLDTNIFVEYIFERNQFQSVQRVFQAVQSKQMDAVTSTATFYTLAYLSERMLKFKGYHRPELTEQVRKIIQSMLRLVCIGSMEQSDMEVGVNDTSFTDIEDSFQYYCAVKNQCDYLLTINSSDFSNANQTAIEILTPNEFVEKAFN